MKSALNLLSVQWPLGNETGIAEKKEDLELLHLKGPVSTHTVIQPSPWPSPSRSSETTPSSSRTSPVYVLLHHGTAYRELHQPLLSQGS